MANELSAGSGPPPPEGGFGRDDDQDTFMASSVNPDGETTAAKLEHIRVRAAEVVRGLEMLLGAGVTNLQGQQSANLDTIFHITDGGEVNTHMARLPPTQHRLEDHMFAKFQTRFTTPPSIIVGLHYLHADRQAHVRIDANAHNVHTHLFEVHSVSWDDSIIYATGFTWLAIPNGNPLLQIGTFFTGEDHPWQERKELTHARINFRNPYRSPPKVVVWLRQIVSDKKFNERVTAFATDITATGFTVHINTWGDSFLYQGGISWFAYPADTPGIASGVVQPTKGTVGVVTFDKPFAKPPRRVLVALNKLETDKANDCRFRVIWEAVSEWGMAVRVETWGDSKIHTAGVSYIVME